ncbi:MAG: hypothetical protein ACYDB4_19475, partial [Candidatus Dormibacteraceae bacterium]
GSVTVSGSDFTAGSTATIYFVQPTSSPRAIVSVTFGGSFSKVVTIPPSAVRGAATIRACDTFGLCASQPVSVTGG